MNAAEARQRTLFARTRDTLGAELYKLVVARIIEAADRGHDNLMHLFDYGGRNTPTQDEIAAVRKRLIADGYIVNKHYDNDHKT